MLDASLFLQSLSKSCAESGSPTAIAILDFNSLNMADGPISPSPAKFVTKVLEEVGLLSLYHSGLDTKLLCIQRFVRLFAYGSSTLILATYLSVLGHPESKIGLFMTLTLVGDVIISFGLTIFADGVGRKWVLALGALMMCGAGLAFGLSGNYWVLLAAAILGVISPRFGLAAVGEMGLLIGDVQRQ